jgi:hypothetical protein
VIRLRSLGMCCLSYLCCARIRKTRALGQLVYARPVQCLPGTHSLGMCKHLLLKLLLLQGALLLLLGSKLMMALKLLPLLLLLLLLQLLLTHLFKLLMLL